jgi:hypothetical protein
MPASTVRTFADPDAYCAALRARRVEGVVTARGNFHAEVTRVDFDRLLMQRAEENLPRVLFYVAGVSRPESQTAVPPPRVSRVRCCSRL